MSPRRLLPLAAVLMLGALLALGLRLNPREVPSPLIGKPAPAFRLPMLADTRRHLSPQDLHGQVWLLNVWASWCGPCRDEHALLVALARDGAVPIVGLNYKDDPRNAQEWLLRLGDPYIASVSDADGRAAIDYGVYGVPETFVIDRDGLVRFKHVGPMTREAWSAQVAPLLQRLRG